MLNKESLELLRRHGKPRYAPRRSLDARDGIFLDGSDYPHNIGDMKGCLARVDALPAAARERVRGGTAQRVFNL